jgi:hypothetical protein
MSVLQQARDSGKCPPSLLSEDRVVEGDDFDSAVLKVLDVNGKMAAVASGCRVLLLFRVRLTIVWFVRLKFTRLLPRIERADR